jgi:hypothetical protein
VFLQVICTLKQRFSFCAVFLLNSLNHLPTETVDADPKMFRISCPCSIVSTSPVRINRIKNCLESVARWWLAVHDFGSIIGDLICLDAEAGVTTVVTVDRLFAMQIPAVIT